MSSYEHSVKLAKEKYPKKTDKPIKYGTAGFRTKADGMGFVMYRMGLMAAIRSQFKKAAIGVMITASHNPIEDNGIKLIDPMGEMLSEDWEVHATNLANTSEEGIADVLKDLVKKYNIYQSYTPYVIVGRDTRPSSADFQKAVETGAESMKSEIKDLGVTSTPILHYVVMCHNDGGVYGTPTEEGYFSKLSQAFVQLGSKISSKGNYKPSLYFDGANGVGYMKMLDMIPHLKGTLNIQMFNKGEGILNHLCGADFVKSTQKWPTGVPEVSGMRCASVDGDADRIVYSYIDSNEVFHLLDGDKLATLMAVYIKSLVEKAGLDLQLGLVQTAYANGASTEYVEKTLGIPVACSKTGVKHLHHCAQKFDIGVYFEANGHGTVLFSDKATKIIKEAKETGNSNALDLFYAQRLINETVGDAISDLLLVETVLMANGWNAKDWDESYTDLPNKLVKITVADRTVISTTDAERICTSPEGLQDTINGLVKKYSKGRSFVRASGTEDVVRVYAETSEKKTTDLLAYEVCCAVYEQAGGIGDKPKYPSNL